MSFPGSLSWVSGVVSSSASPGSLSFGSLSPATSFARLFCIFGSLSPATSFARLFCVFGSVFFLVLLLACLFWLLHFLLRRVRIIWTQSFGQEDIRIHKHQKMLLQIATCWKRETTQYTSKVVSLKRKNTKGTRMFGWTAQTPTKNMASQMIFCWKAKTPKEESVTSHSLNEQGCLAEKQKQPTKLENCEQASNKQADVCWKANHQRNKKRKFEPTPKEQGYLAEKTKHPPKICTNDVFTPTKNMHKWCFCWNQSTKGTKKEVWTNT